MTASSTRKPKRPLRRARRTAASRRAEWKLEDAKARFSEVVRAARSDGPQHVTLYGKDAVVVLSAEDYARLKPLADQPSLHALLSESPLRDLAFEPGEMRSPVRGVKF